MSARDWRELVDEQDEHARRADPHARCLEACRHDLGRGVLVEELLGDAWGPETHPVMRPGSLVPPWAAR